MAVLSPFRRCMLRRRPRRGDRPPEDVVVMAEATSSVRTRADTPRRGAVLVACTSPHPPTSPATAPTARGHRDDERQCHESGGNAGCTERGRRRSTDPSRTVGGETTSTTTVNSDGPRPFGQSAAAAVCEIDDRDAAAGSGGASPAHLQRRLVRAEPPSAVQRETPHPKPQTHAMMLGRIAPFRGSRLMRPTLRPNMDMGLHERETPGPSVAPSGRPLRHGAESDDPSAGAFRPDCGGDEEAETRVVADPLGSLSQQPSRLRGWACDREGYPGAPHRTRAGGSRRPVTKQDPSEAGSHVNHAR